MADYYRQFHLYFLKGKEGSELDSTSALDKDYAALSWSANFMAKLTLFFYRNYTANQEVMTPVMQRLRRELRSRYGGDEVPRSFRDAFRKQSLPLMKFTNMLSFNTRVIALFVSLFIDMPWLYFVFEMTVLNSMLLYMIRTHERICKEMIDSL